MDEGSYVIPSRKVAVNLILFFLYVRRRHTMQSGSERTTTSAKLFNAAREINIAGRFPQVPSMKGFQATSRGRQISKTPKALETIKTIQKPRTMRDMTEKADDGRAKIGE